MPPATSTTRSGWPPTPGRRRSGFRRRAPTSSPKRPRWVPRSGPPPLRSAPGRTGCRPTTPISSPRISKRRARRWPRPWTPCAAGPPPSCRSARTPGVPLRSQLTSWVDVAREALRGSTAVPQIKKAEDWVKRTGEAMRNERFDPIAQHSIRIWEQLRLQSNVTLGKITLESSGKRRRVDLHVQVDGVDGAALGVMSQGELHCLALSLFIPRATLAESPFRFIVIDDPVQSMDPARVDGLARVLEARGQGPPGRRLHARRPAARGRAPPRHRRAARSR